MNIFYDFKVVGAGISACTFALFLNKRFTNSSILLVEHGRQLGARFATRKSRKNIILDFDDGLLSISFSNNISKDLLTIVSPLLKSRKLIDITNDIVLINKFGDIVELLTNQKMYRSLPYMINFCEEIIN